MPMLLETLREEFELKLKTIQDTIARDIVFTPVLNKISVFIGMRRTGKTVFMCQQILQLLNSGVKLSEILYLNFEDDRLLAQDHQLFVSLVDAFYEMYPENYDKKCYLFLDEIQHVPEWPIVVRRFFDTKKVAIYLTGSSAKLLSKEIASSLRGRSLSTEVWPFSLPEFYIARDQNLLTGTLGKKAFDQYLKQLENYLHLGGFPETGFVTADIRQQILQDYVHLVVMRDIIERYNISNIPLIHYMIKSLLKNVGSRFTVNKFLNDVKSQGFSCSKNTVYEYLQYLEDAYLIFTVPIYAESIRKVYSNPKKVYAIDSGLVNAYTFSLSSNVGHLFENLVYLDLRRKKHEIHYYMTKEGYEVDFFSQDKQGKTHLWQVVWDVSNKETLARETRALNAAEKEMGIKGEIITPESYLGFLSRKDDGNEK